MNVTRVCGTFIVNHKYRFVLLIQLLNPMRILSRRFNGEPFNVQRCFYCDFNYFSIFSYSLLHTRNTKTSTIQFFSTFLTMLDDKVWVYFTCIIIKPHPNYRFVLTGKIRQKTVLYDLHSGQNVQKLRDVFSHINSAVFLPGFKFLNGLYICIS